MKKIILSIVILICANQILHSQTLRDSISTNRKHNDELSMQYLEKGKKLETTGFVLLGVGLAATIVGSIGALNNYDIFFSAEAEGYIVLWALGVGAISTGIPILASGFHYKRKAKLILRNENVFRSYHVPVKENIVSIGIAFNLR